MLSGHVLCQIMSPVMTWIIGIEQTQERVKSETLSAYDKVREINVVLSY